MLDIELRELKGKLQHAFNLMAVQSQGPLKSHVCVLRRGFNADGEKRGQRLIWDSVGEKEGTVKKKREGGE